jgi:hypothetical protein
MRNISIIIRCDLCENDLVKYKNEYIFYHIINLKGYYVRSRRRINSMLGRCCLRCQVTHEDRESVGGSPQRRRGQNQSYIKRPVPYRYLQIGRLRSRGRLPLHPRPLGYWCRRECGQKRN